MSPERLERKLAAVLYADVAGYSRLTGEDEEGTHRILSRYLDALTAAIKGHGGRVVHYAGDAILAEFTSVLKSLSCATNIQQELSIRNRELPEQRRLQFRIGINLGDVIVDRDDIYGEGVNIAARLESLADPGGICISEAVRDAVGNQLSLAYEFMGEQAVKNISKPIRAYRVLLDSTSRATPTRRSSANERSALIGRHSQLHQFRVMLQACHDTGNGQVLYLRGEAGIGKTRLVEAMQSLAKEQGFNCHSGLVLDFGVGKGQDVIRILIRSLLNLSLTSPTEQTWQTARHALQQGLFSADQQVFLNDLLNLPQPTTLRALYEAMDTRTRQQGKQTIVARLIHILSHRRPLLLTVEDIHWADAPTLAHLAHLVATLNEYPVLLIMTSRLAGEPMTAGWRGALYGASLTTMDLGPLRTTEALALAEHISNADSAFIRHCVERAGGNPLFLEQLLRTADPSADMPVSMQNMIRQQLEQLDPIDKQALQTASVLGQRFSLSSLRFLLDNAHYRCTELIAQGLVRPQGEDYLFAHALILEAIYNSLPQVQKQNLHRRAAEWFRDRDVLLYAQQLERAEDPAAAAAYLDAARTQVQSYRYERALDLIQQGLLLAHDNITEYELTYLHGELLRESGSVDTAIDEFHHALHLAVDGLRQCRAQIGIALGLSSQDKPSETLIVLEQAASTLKRQHNPKELAQIYVLKGNTLFAMGRDCLKAHEQALCLARQAASPDLEARTLSGLGNAYYQRGRMITAYDYFHHCVQLCHEHGLCRIEAANLTMRGWTNFYQNRLPLALQDASAAVALANKIGNQYDESLARTMHGVMLYYMADWDSAKQQFEQSLLLARAIGSKRFQADNLCHLGAAHLALGSGTEAEQCLETAYALSQESGQHLDPWMFSIMALAASDPEKRDWALKQGEALLQRSCVSHHYLHFYQNAMELSLSTGNWDAAEHYAKLLQDYTQPQPLPWSEFHIAMGKRLAAFGRGQRDPETRQQLGKLREQAELAGLNMALSRLDLILYA